MPLVFAENEETESGITYEDRTGIAYQYPPMYQRLICPGERFVYYKGRRTRGGGRAPQVYFGTGIVGEVRSDPAQTNRLVCDVLDFIPFLQPVPFKDRGGDYLETGAGRRGYFQRGVREVSENDFQKIIRAAQGPALGANGEKVALDRLKRENDISPTSRDGEAAASEFAIKIAVREIEHRYPGRRIQVQPRINPGFSILIPAPPQVLYVGVKGTDRNIPHIRMSEGELRFARLYASSFSLVIVWNIVRASGGCDVFWHEGELSERRFNLRPVEWVCDFKGARSTGP